MENMHNNVSLQSAFNKKKASFTPRELIRHHMENPHLPITDEDIENLDLNHDITLSSFAIDLAALPEKEDRLIN